jgi:hypothetical protein
MIQRDHSRVGGLGRTIAIVLAVVALALPADRAFAQVPASCPPALGAADLIDNDFSVSFCELCDVGTVRIIVENPIRTSPGDVDLSRLVVR